MTNSAESDAPWVCYPCARGDHAEHKINAWEPGIRCECSCVFPPVRSDG